MNSEHCCFAKGANQFRI